MWPFDKIPEDYNDLLISTTFILVTLIICELLRFILKYVFKGKEGLSTKLVYELIASGELCACCFELCIIADRYGIWTYANLLFVLTVWWSFKWGEASGCPYTHIEDFLQGQSKLKHVLLIIVIQILGGCSVYPFYVRKFWDLKYESSHADRVLSNKCSADLTVPVLHGVFIEGIATCMCQLTARVMSQLNPKFGNPITAFVGTALVVAAFDMSGGYFNPVLATALQLNCGEVSKLDHFTVYWGGSIGGSIASVLIWHSSTLSRNLLGDRPKIE